MKNLFDSHAHISSPELYPKVNELLERAKNRGVEGIVNICTDKETLKSGLKIADENTWVYNAGATTPHDVEKEGDLYFDLFEKAAREKKLVAIGETGLDYFYERSPKDLQKKFLKRYLNLAWELNLPVIFHCREAFDDLFAICDAEFGRSGGFPAILHCFTGSMKESEEVVSRGWFLSLSGIVTYKKSDSLREVAREVPLNQLLIETDSPYLAPQSMRGKVNEPSNIYETAEVIAKCKDLKLTDITIATRDNALKVFNISK